MTKSIPSRRREMSRVHQHTELHTCSRNFPTAAELPVVLLGADALFLAQTVHGFCGVLSTKATSADRAATALPHAQLLSNSP